MARIRTIKPEFPQSESMGRVSRDARLTFIMLWTIADDSGRLRGNSRMLASLLFPYDDDARKHIDSWLGELERENCITRYVVDGDSYLQVNGWANHQKIDKPSASKIPPPPESSRILANPRESSPLDQGEDQGREGNGDSAEDEASPPAFTIPLIDKSEYGVTQAQVDEWSAAYPAVNVPQQLREMRAWSLANPNQRKTSRGVNAFVVRWLSKEQDKGGGPRADVRLVTVPGTPGRDPTLIKLDEDAKRAAPIPDHIRAQIGTLKGKVFQ
jgi:hypothetical protein